MNASISAKVVWVVMAFKRNTTYPSLQINVGTEEALKYDRPVHEIEASERKQGNEGASRPDDRFEKMKSWIANCTKTHSGCGEKSKDGIKFLPTRLLDLFAGGREDSIRLVLTKEIDRQTQRVGQGKDDYLTLSYCWGTQAQNSKTTIQNFEDRQRNISISTLPKTIQDAVEMTRKLGIQPTQNDIEDWLKEAKMMSQIYRNSVCTIAACISDNCDGGLFELRDAAKLRSSRCLMTEGRQGCILEPKVDHWYTDVELATLSTRGWVLQERLLTARTIFCTEEGLYWQCGTACSSEFNENIATDWSYKSTHKESTPRLDDLVKEWRKPVKEFEFAAQGVLSTKNISFLQSFVSHTRNRHVEARPWHQLVYDFTRRNLTQPEDRLPAVLGIGTFFAKAVGDTYVENAGMWKSDLMGGMAWYRDWGHDSKRLSKAPSWSWAAVSGQVTSMYKRTKHVVNIAQVDWRKTIATSCENSSNISELHISGPACRIQLYRAAEQSVFGAKDPDAETPVSPPSKKKALFIFNVTVSRDSISGAKSAPGLDERIGWAGAGKNIQRNHYEVIFDVSTDHPALGTEFLCMPLVSAGFALPTAQSFPMGIVLVPVDAERKIYRRVGWCFMWSEIPADRVRNVEVVLV
ncbi:heterokaryon incompatibility protein [Phlyctema vagabunda]|uniref:Heterokaryon incompatibility protein n=1 Tax=Phlyctema vagabunda TaxID=108571 RepID=A0ABR4P3M0_9HELO